MADLQQRTIAELTRRAGRVPTEQARLRAAIDADKDGLGIHQSQFKAIAMMMDDLEKKLVASTGALAALAHDVLAEKYLEVIAEIAAVDDVWHVFGMAMHQRADPAIRTRLDLADLVAADCYRQAMLRASAWKLVPVDEPRPPPLVVLETGTTAAAASRGEKLDLLAHPQRKYRNIRLTVPLVLLPPDHIQSAWLLCAVYHEVGHNIDLDLKLREELKKKVLALTPNPQPQARNDLWWSWTPEILADAFGVLFGGAGYVEAMAALLIVSAPAALFGETDETDPHPNPWVRTLLLCDLLDALGVADWLPTTAAIRETWGKLARPAWVDDYVSDAKAIAALLLDTALDQLGGRTLRTLIDPLAAHRQSELRKYLLKQAPRPDPKEARYREVPAAAQLAIVAAGDPATAFDLVDARALGFAAAITRPRFLGLSGDQEKVLAEVLAELDLHGGAG